MSNDWKPPKSLYSDLFFYLPLTSGSRHHRTCSYHSDTSGPATVDGRHVPRNCFYTEKDNSVTIDRSNQELHKSTPLCLN